VVREETCKRSTRLRCQRDVLERVAEGVRSIAGGPADPGEGLLELIPSHFGLYDRVD
jgi:hypothetical protein